MARREQFELNFRLGNMRVATGDSRSYGRRDELSISNGLPRVWCRALRQAK